MKVERVVGKLNEKLSETINTADFAYISTTYVDTVEFLYDGDIRICLWDSENGQSCSTEDELMEIILNEFKEKVSSLFKIQNTLFETWYSFKN